MHPFIETVSYAGAVAAVIVASIIVLTLFFRGLAWLSRVGGKPETLSVRGVLKKNTLATVHLSSGEVFERVRLIGYTDPGTIKTHLPYELNGMVILEEENGTRFLVRAKQIRMIVIAPETPATM